eukprot:TRINITY_DN1063_c0_g2_i8.p1 TRINITY_DN1063_c0_g2~~TRINITY_DN1063_c0_g2_i8.p1  ORF type:complete len:505 (-),score=74.45 TRINITY_DN1063_c0_g2_i8:13-1527(-)
MSQDKDEGSESGYAPHKAYCPHVKEHVKKMEKPLVALDSKCELCPSIKENWICLNCKTVRCGRFAQAHMVEHTTATGHQVVFGTGDLSFWCYSCESYLDAAKIPQIYQVYKIYHEHAFGVAPGDVHVTVDTGVPGTGTGKTEDEASKLGVNLSEIKEVEESEEVLLAKAKSLAEMINASKSAIVFTGAGLSTGAGIPDFRGPTGVWTLKAQGKRPVGGVSITQALPTSAHMALVGLVNAGKLKFVISQNIDGLHRRSGIQASRISELHGNCYLEVCWECKKEYLRDFDVSSDSGHTARNGKCTECLKRVPHFCHCTGRACSCGAMLKDSIIHFSENLPEGALISAFEAAQKSDLCIILGSSLRVSPACDIPKETKKKGGKLVIVNLQTTPQDKKADLRVFGKTDMFLTEVMKQLKIEIPSFDLTKSFIVGSHRDSASGKDVKWTCYVHSDGGGQLSDFIEKVVFTSSSSKKAITLEEEPFEITEKIGRAVQQECRDRSRMPSSA